MGVVFLLPAEILDQLQPPVLLDRNGGLAGSARPSAALTGAARPTGSVGGARPAAGVLTGQPRPTSTLGA